MTALCCSYVPKTHIYAIFRHNFRSNTDTTAPKVSITTLPNSIKHQQTQTNKEPNMKTLAVVTIIVAFLAIVFCAPAQTNTQFLRIHIRADSNDQADQDVKYLVKNAVVNYLAPHLANATTKQKAMQIVEQQLQNIQHVCQKTLQNNGFTYSAKVKLCKESFPDRSYNGVTLPQGVYDALIIELGSAQGNNWWCVVYPPLCFVGAENNGTNTIVFQSKLVEIVNQWLANNK